MAKKKKQKKAGIEKRRKNKQHRKTATKKKLISQKPVQKKLSPSKVKQNLKNIPSLIFEPELEEIAFTAEQIQEVKKDYEKIPDQINALGTPEFLEKLKVQHEVMKERFEAENDANKTMMAHAIIYFMEEEDAPAFLNQIVVAMYLNTVNVMETGERLELKQLNSLLKDYDRDWADYLKEKADELALSRVSEGVEEEPELTEEEEKLIAPSAFESVIESFAEHLESDTSIEEDNRERIIEDVEVLVNDYCEEKEITSLDALRARKIKTFLEGWFIKTMNPTREDLENMLESMEVFFKFAKTSDLIPEDKSEDILKLLSDREAFLSNLSF